MKWKNSLKILQTPHLLSAFLLRRDLQSFLRTHFLFAAYQSGILAALKTPLSKAQLASQIQASNMELLDPLLDLGVALRELSLHNNLYSLRGRRARTLAAADGDPLAAWLLETVSYHGSVFRHFSERVKGGSLGDYLSGTGDLIARSSRIFEPYVSSFAQSVVANQQPLHLLEVGCGSGVYLRYAAEANPGLTGLAIDMQEDVIRQAQSNLKQWNLSDRFDLRIGNILNLPEEIAGPYDVVTLYNNIYYFPVDARVDLFRIIKQLLSPQGRLALVSTFQGKSIESINLDLVLRSTIGCAPLPNLVELDRQLAEAGFNQVEHIPLMPGGWLYGILAQNS